MNEIEPKRRVNSMRWESWDYGAQGAYFITTNCKNFEIWFGSVKNDEMIHNEFGKIAVRCWENLPLHFKDISLGAFVVMPNHVHGIIHLLQDHLVQPAGATVYDGPAALRKGNQGANTISAMGGSFKSAVSRAIHIIDPRFEWKPKFHDRVIRDFEEYERITNYILNNPANWKGDEFYRS